MKAAVALFPGSNCDRDAITALALVTGVRPATVWYQEPELPDVDLVVVPGGFTYGDYLRPGAMAARSPVMAAIAAHARAGRFVLGICNGFQMLCEAGLLPGALTRNAGLTFLSKPVPLTVAAGNSAFTARYAAGQAITLPIAHHDGRYVAGAETLERLEGEGRIAFRYGQNPNGSQGDIAGLFNAERTVLGLMPHPERAVDPALGGTDGRGIFESLAEALS